MPNPIEEVAPQAGAAVQGTNANVEGPRSIFVQLSEEHAEVTALLLRVEGSSDPGVVLDLFPLIRAELISHETGELAEVYPVLSKHEELARFAEEHDREAEDLDQRIRLLVGISYSDPSWPELFNDLVRLVSQHVEEEESRIFPLATRILAPGESEQILTRYFIAKGNAPLG
jgi:hypothetical protein